MVIDKGVFSTKSEKKGYRLNLSSKHWLVGESRLSTIWQLWITLPSRGLKSRWWNFWPMGVQGCQSSVCKCLLSSFFTLGVNTRRQSERRSLSYNYDKNSSIVEQLWRDPCWMQKFLDCCWNYFCSGYTSVFQLQTRKQVSINVFP